MKLAHTLLGAWHRLLALAGRRRRDRALREEIDFHLAMRQRDYERTGASPTDARLAARRQFGNVTLLTERTADMWTFPSFESVVQDVRYALRSLIKSPGFSVVAILVLAIGIGANTAMFSLVDAMLLRGLPYPDSDRLVLLIGNVQRETAVERRGNSLPDHRDWTAKATRFEDMSPYDSFSITVLGTDEAERVSVEAVSPSYFSLLGVVPTHGRTFRPNEDEVPNRDYVVVLSDGLWRRRFGADPAIVNSTIQLSGRAYEVVGIMPAGFAGITDTAELWLPFALAGWTDNRGSRGFQTLARLKTDATIDEARAELDVISAQLATAYPATNDKRAVEVSPLQVETVGQLQPIVITLMTAVSFVLLIACANVANLLIGRSEARQKEIAVRTALGAGRARLARQLITESCVLTGIGAAAGLGLAHLLVAGVTAASPVQFPSFVQPALNLSVLAFTIGVAVIGGVLLGLAPAIHARLARLTDGLKESTRGGSGGLRAQRLRGVLVVAEVALAIVLLIGAGLTIRSTQKLAAIDPGFDPSGLLTVTVSMPRQPAPPGTAAAVPGQPAPPPPFVMSGRELVERVSAVPGVTSVSLSTDVPLAGGGSAVFYTAEGDQTSDAQMMPRAYVHRVSPNFFETVRMPLLSGRTFLQSELTAASTSVIVSDGVVRRFWPNQNPIGKRIKFGAPTSTNPWLTIVGVVPETKYRALPANPTNDPDFYFPALDRSPQPLIIRTSVPPASVLPSVRTALTRGQSGVAVFATSTMAELVDTQTSASRFTMWVLGLFAATALILSAIGIYGVMSYLVTQRTREFGIRIALGASRGEIVGSVLGRGAILIGLGAAIGLALTAGLSRLFGSLLYEVTAIDFATALAVVVLIAAAILACVVPAMRATRVDPAVALRNS
jgi:putative ABC transport system permease protein